MVCFSLKSGDCQIVPERYGIGKSPRDQNLLTKLIVDIATLDHLTG